MTVLNKVINLLSGVPDGLAERISCITPLCQRMQLISITTALTFSNVK